MHRFKNTLSVEMPHACSGWIVGLPDFGMDATGDLSHRRVHVAMEIKPILLPVRCPTFLQIAGGDTGSSKRQDHGADTDVRLHAHSAGT